jgi:hypothetical protein
MRIMDGKGGGNGAEWADAVAGRTMEAYQIARTRRTAQRDGILPAIALSPFGDTLMD